MLNLEIRTLEDGILELVNQSPLLPEIKRLVLSDVLHLVTKQADNMCMEEYKNEVAENAESAPEHKLGE